MNHATSITAAALLAALGGSAAAQGNVTLYGLLDVAAGRFKGAPGGVNARDQAVHKLDGGGLSTSHWGLRGTEDLGGGLAASFELSGFLRNDSGTVGRSDAIPAPVNVAADPFWSRAAWVGLGSARLGRLRLGNVTTLMFLNAISSNAFGDSTVFAPLNLVTFIGSPQAGGTGWTNSIVYDSPAISGFAFSAARSMAEAQGGHNSALRLSHTQGAWSASLAWQDVKKNPLTFADGTSANNTRSWQLAAAYDFEVVKLFAHLGRIDNRGTETAPQHARYRLWDLSAAAPIGTGRVLAGVAQRKTGDRVAPVPATAAGGNLERRVLTVGYDHYLSKRTDVYALLMNDRTRTSTLPAASLPLGASATSGAVGLRHRF
jgi:predicted porin